MKTLVILPLTKTQALQSFLNLILIQELFLYFKVTVPCHLFVAVLPLGAATQQWEVDEEEPVTRISGQKSCKPHCRKTKEN